MVEAIISYLALLLVVGSHVFWDNTENRTGTVRTVEVVYGVRKAVAR